LAGGEAVVHIQRSSYGLSVNDHLTALGSGCVDVAPILQDPTIEALELT
jgi:hypothetical protein